jgi:prepilin-type N-terminal cleavage/methylation domain-containing protein
MSNFLFPISSRQRGVTLIEAMVVVGILGIIAAIAAPNVRDFVTRYRLDSSANELASALRLARQEALRRNAAVEACTANNAWLVRSANNVPPDIKQGSFRAEITVQTNIPSNGGISCVQYRGDGVPRSGMGTGEIPRWTFTLNDVIRSVCVRPGRVEIANGPCPT